MQVKKQLLELDMEQQTGSTLGKEYVKAVYCHPAYLTYMQGTACKMLGRMKHKLELRLLEEISITLDMQTGTRGAAGKAAAPSPVTHRTFVGRLVLNHS